MDLPVGEAVIPMWIIPDDTSKLDSLFEAFSECSALNPDEDTSDQDNNSDNDQEGFNLDGFITADNADQAMELFAAANAMDNLTLEDKKED